MTTLGQLKVLAPMLLSKVLAKDSAQRKRVNSFLVKQMGESKGLWLKVGQMLSLKPESWEGLEDLPDSEKIPSIPEEDFRPYLESLFSDSGFPLEENFSSLKFPGLAASLSQAHEVIDREGKSWMVKAKLPGIEDIVMDQLSILGFVRRLEGVQGEKKSFSTSQYQRTIKQSFARELDYDQERKNLTQFQKLQNFFETVKVPKLHEKIQSPHFIVMEKMEGDSWSTVLNSYTHDEKIEVGRQLVLQFLYQYFCMDEAQGDFHPGNFFFQRKGEEVLISWIDLGQCLTPTPLEKKALFLSLESLLNQENITLGPLFKAWNFNIDKLSPIADRLPLLVTKIFTPFTYPTAFELKKWHLQKDIENILGEDRWWFRTAGSPDLFLSIRCWIGLFSMLEALDVPLFFKGYWAELRAEISKKITSENLPESELKQVTFDDLAKNLKVQVFDNGIEKVQVTLPARAIEDIKSFLSSETLSEMEKVGVNLDQVIKEQLQKGLIPSTVIDFLEGKKRYLVTLS